MDYASAFKSMSICPSPLIADPHVPLPLGQLVDQQVEQRSDYN